MINKVEGMSMNESTKKYYLGKFMVSVLSFTFSCYDLMEM